MANDWDKLYFSCNQFSKRHQEKNNVRCYILNAMGMKVSDLCSPLTCSKSYRVKISLLRKNSLFAQKTNCHRVPNFESPNSSKTACLYTLIKTLYEIVATKRQTFDIFGASTYIIVK